MIARIIPEGILAEMSTKGIPEPFGSRVLRLRTERKLAAPRGDKRWTQAGLSQQTGIGQSAISKIELNQTKSIDSDSLQALARVFGLQGDDLIAGTTFDTQGGHLGTSPDNPDRYNHPSTKARQNTGGASDTHSAGEGERADIPVVTWDEPADQKQYGRDLRRAAILLLKLGGALALGKARIVEQDRPVSGERRRSLGVGPSRVSGAKKSRAV